MKKQPKEHGMDERKMIAAVASLALYLSRMDSLDKTETVLESKRITSRLFLYYDGEVLVDAPHRYPTPIYG